MPGVQPHDMIMKPTNLLMLRSKKLSTLIASVLIIRLEINKFVYILNSILCFLTSYVIPS